MLPPAFTLMLVKPGMEAGSKVKLVSRAPVLRRRATAVLAEPLTVSKCPMIMIEPLSSASAHVNTGHRAVRLGHGGIKAVVQGRSRGIVGIVNVQPGQAGAADADGRAEIPRHQQLAIPGPQGVDDPINIGHERMIRTAVPVEPGQILMELAAHPGEIAADDD